MVLVVDANHHRKREEVTRMTDKKLLEEAIKKSGYKKGFIAEKIGLTRAGFRNCINNEAEFKASQIQTLCDMLGLDNEQKNAIFFANDGV